MAPALNKTLMFQDFENPTIRDEAGPRVAALRDLLRKHKIDAYLVPRADEHQGEYVAPQSERLKWLTGFSGSAGLAIVTKKKAALFVDGRYTVQARAEVNEEIFEFHQVPAAKLSNWIRDNLRKGSTVGFDPKLHTINATLKLTEALKEASISLKAIARANLIDLIWDKTDIQIEVQKIQTHPLEYAGRAHTDKLAEIQSLLKSQSVHATILTLPDSICWLLNIRGQDIPHNPVVLAFAIVPTKGKCELFVESEKLTPAVRRHLKPVAHIFQPTNLSQRLTELKSTGQRINLDPTSASHWFAMRLRKDQIAYGSDPCLRPKAIKNKTEIAGLRRAHVRDGHAVVRFLHWLDEKTKKTNDIDEIIAAKELEGLRAQSNKLCEISFDTIAGSGANGAIVHYRVNQTTNRKLKNGELFLIDSGAQYLDGTTDITRTVAIGQPTREMCDRFTRVLKGHIAIATAKFPSGTRGADLDPFARRALWDAGLDFDHGTGHGVGSYLNVHEGPVSISRRGMVPLEPGMLLSNEPGYYKEQHYGIRIENLVLVKNVPDEKDSERDMLSFETVTLAPIDRRLIVTSMLTDDERNWLNTYHHRVFETLASDLNAQTRTWLRSATTPLKG